MTTEDRKTTPKTWSAPEDARTKKGAGTYPNYYTHKTRSGHVFTMDDSEGAENITIQHRTGTTFQVGPDGVLSITANKGQYNIVFGENRLLVTGAQDVTVQGASSLRVEGDYNVNATGNMNMTVKGDANFAIAGNMNTVVKGDNVTQTMGNQTTDVSGSTKHTSLGSHTTTAKSGMTLASDGNMAMDAGTVGLRARTTAMIESGENTNLSSGGSTEIAAKGSYNVTAPTFNQNTAGTPTPKTPTKDFAHVKPAAPDRTTTT